MTIAAVISAMGKLLVCFSFPRSAWERSDTDALRRSATPAIAAERLGICVPTRSVGTSCDLGHRDFGAFGRVLALRRPPGSCRPAIASDSIFTISSIDRMLSSLPGIGRSTRSGSQSVSISATVAMPSLLGLADRVLFLLRDRR